MTMDIMQDLLLRHRIYSRILGSLTRDIHSATVTKATNKHIMSEFPLRGPKTTAKQVDVLVATTAVQPQVLTLKHLLDDLGW